MKEIERTLRQYRDLVKERADLQKRIRRTRKRLEVTQTESVRVSKGRRGSHSLGGETVTGSVDRERMTRSLSRYTELLKQCEHDIDARLATAEQYIQTVDSAEVRLILRYRYIDGLSWEHCAIQLGGGNSADGCRMICRRWFDAYD